MSWLVEKLGHLTDVSVSGAAEGDMVYQNDSGLWVVVGGTKADGKAPMVQTDGSVQWETPAGGGGGVFSGVAVYRTADQAISPNTITAIQWTAEEWDTDSYHDTSTNNTRLAAPVDGKYSLAGAVSATGLAGGAGDYQVRASVDGSVARQFIRAEGGALQEGGSATFSIATTLDLEAASYVEIEAFCVDDAFSVRSGSVWTHVQLTLLG